MDDQNLHWLVRPKTIRRLWIWGSVGLAVIALGDIAVPLHGVFGIDSVFGFYSWYGFLTCVAMILFAKVLGFFLKRKDTYYDGE